MKTLKLSKTDFDFMLNNMELTAKCIISYELDSESKNISFLVEDYSDFQDMVNFDIVNTGMDNQETVNEQGKRMYQLYDIILAQK